MKNNMDINPRPTVKVGMLVKMNSAVGIGIVTWVGEKRWDCFPAKSYYKIVWTDSGRENYYPGTTPARDMEIIDTKK